VTVSSTGGSVGCVVSTPVVVGICASPHTPHVASQLSGSVLQSEICSRGKTTHIQINGMMSLYNGFCLCANNMVRRLK
jgi:hypothetical protein